MLCWYVAYQSVTGRVIGLIDEIQQWQALRADWREMMIRTRREIGFDMVRFHGLLDDDMRSVVCVCVCQRAATAPLACCVFDWF
jgi:hypothetical protein